MIGNDFVSQSAFIGVGAFLETLHRYLKSLAWPGKHSNSFVAARQNSILLSVDLVESTFAQLTLSKLVLD